MNFCFQIRFSQKLEEITETRWTSFFPGGSATVDVHRPKIHVFQIKWRYGTLTATAQIPLQSPVWQIKHIFWFCTVLNVTFLISVCLDFFQELVHCLFLSSVLPFLRFFFISAMEFFWESLEERYERKPCVLSEISEIHPPLSPQIGDKEMESCSPRAVSLAPYLLSSFHSLETGYLLFSSGL